MKFGQIQVGDKVKYTLKKSRDKNKIFSESHITKLYDSQRIFDIASFVLLGGKMVDKGDLIEFTIFTKMGPISCDCMILREYEQNGVYSTALRVASPVVQAQMRAHPRYSMRVPMRYYVLGVNEALREELSVFVNEGVVIDLSGGGLRFRGNIPSDRDTRVGLMIEKSDGVLLAEVHVLGLHDMNEPDLIYRYEMRAKFINTKNVPKV